MAYGIWQEIALHVCMLVENKFVTDVAAVCDVGCYWLRVLVVRNPIHVQWFND